MKLSRKATSAILYFFVILFISTMGALYLFLSNAMSDRQTEILSLNRDLAVAEIEDQFSNIGSVVYSLASIVRVDDDITGLKNLLVDIELNNDLITQIYIGKPDKSFVISSDFIAPPGFDITVRPWYLKALESTNVSYTDAYIDAVEEIIVMTVVYPVYNDQDQLLAVIGADIEVNAITSFIKSFIAEDTGYMFVLDNYGNVLAHTSLDSNIVELESYEVFDIPYDLLVHGEGITDIITSNGERGKISYRTITDSGFTVGEFMSITDLNQSLYMIAIVSVAAVFMIFAFLVLMVFLFNYYIYHPLTTLIDDISKIDIVHNSEYRMDITNKSGFNDARLALNKLIEISVDYQSQLKKMMDNVALENQKFELLLASSSDIVFVIDKDQRYVNLYGTKAYVSGITQESAKGKTHREAFGDYFADERERQYARALAGEEVLYNWDSIYDGKMYYFETVMNPIYNKAGEIVGAVGVARDITEQENRYQEMLYLSTHDYLTDLSNRRVYYQKMKELNDNKDYPFVVINMDLNGLKIINDAFGHEVGDITLKKTAEILVKTVNKTYTISRVSGDEFTIIMPNSGAEEAEELKELLFKEFRKTYIENMNLSVAIGYTIQVDDSVSLDEIRKRAENDMYRQKILERKSVKNQAISAILKTLTDKYETERQHSNRVSKLSGQLGRAMKLDQQSLKALTTAAMFHDIGKISIPDHILNKPGKLTQEEFEIVKTHTTKGYDILFTADQYSELAIHASSHHERWDGKGYPNGLKAEGIPLFSRIICITDAYEAMTSDRPYRKKMSKEAAAREIVLNAGTQFDPELAKLFVEKVLNKIWEDCVKAINEVKNTK